MEVDHRRDRGRRTARPERPTASRPIRGARLCTLREYSERVPCDSDTCRVTVVAPTRAVRGGPQHQGKPHEATWASLSRACSCSPSRRATSTMITSPPSRGRSPTRTPSPSPAPCPTRCRPGARRRQRRRRHLHQRPRLGGRHPGQPGRLRHRRRRRSTPPRTGRQYTPGDGGGQRPERRRRRVLARRRRHAASPTPASPTSARSSTTWPAASFDISGLILAQDPLIPPSDVGPRPLDHRQAPTRPAPRA